jgi:hypothetical protein
MKTHVRVPVATHGHSAPSSRIDLWRTLQGSTARMRRHRAREQYTRNRQRRMRRATSIRQPRSGGGGGGGGGVGGGGGGLRRTHSSPQTSKPHSLGAVMPNSLTRYVTHRASHSYRPGSSQHRALIIHSSHRQLTPRSRPPPLRNVAPDSCRARRARHPGEATVLLGTSRPLTGSLSASLWRELLVNAFEPLTTTYKHRHHPAQHDARSARQQSQILGPHP